MKAIAIPHGDLEFPNLARVVTLPADSREDVKRQTASQGLSRRRQRKLRQAAKAPPARSLV